MLHPLSHITRPVILHCTFLPLFSWSQGKCLVVAEHTTTPDTQSLGQQRALLTTRLVYFNQLHSDPCVWNVLTHHCFRETLSGKHTHIYLFLLHVHVYIYAMCVPDGQPVEAGRRRQMPWQWSYSGYELSGGC